MTAIKPPTRVQVGPLTYTVAVEVPGGGDDGEVRLGVTRYAKTQIAVNPNQSASSMRETLLHEVVHALLDLQGTATGGDKAVIPDEDEERFVRAFTPLLLDVLRRNKQLTAYLLAAE